MYNSFATALPSEFQVPSAWLSSRTLIPFRETAQQPYHPTFVSPPPSPSLSRHPSLPPKSPSPAYPPDHPSPAQRPTSPLTPQIPSSFLLPPSTLVSYNYSHTATHRDDTLCRQPSRPLLLGLSLGIGRVRVGGARGRRWFLRLGLEIWTILMLRFVVARYYWKWWSMWAEERRMVTLCIGMYKVWRRSSLRGGRR
jgi:hypothetical protein